MKKSIVIALSILLASSSLYAGESYDYRHRKQKESSSGEVTVSTSNSVTTPEDRLLIAQAAPGTGYAPGNDGMTAYSPFGGISNSKVAQMNKLKIASEILGTTDEIKGLVKKEMQPCRALGFGPQGLDLGLGGFICWPTLRSEYKEEAVVAPVA